jgi:glycosyltransferase involved in cell wall biosynthesis
MAGHPLVSIVVPSYVRSPQALALLDETLASVDTQTVQDFEAIVVDDGSPLEMEAAVRSHRNAVLVRQQNAGCAQARNAGIARARGRYFIFLDADDHLLPKAIEAGLAALEAHPDHGFAVGPREEMTFEGNPVSWDVAPPPAQSYVYLSLLASDWYILPPSSAMFRRETVERVGGFRDPWGADDLDFYLRAARMHEAVCYQAPAVTRYRRYSTSSSRDGARMLRSIRAVYARERPYVAGNPDAERAHRAGLDKLTPIFRDCLVEPVRPATRAAVARRAAERGVPRARRSGEAAIRRGFAGGETRMNA